MTKIKRMFLSWFIQEQESRKYKLMTSNQLINYIILLHTLESLKKTADINLIPQEKYKLSTGTKTCINLYDKESLRNHYIFSRT